MSRIIKITQAAIEEIMRDFNAAIAEVKLSDGKFRFEKSFKNTGHKAIVHYTEKAWLKQSALVDDSDKEVGWHGVAKRGDEPNEFIIEDILIYPQVVTAATVTTDQEKYQNWLMSQEDDVFNNIRFQGHSHVNMGVTPSTVDETLYERILDQIEDDMFYIFMIWNKRKNRFVRIYDLANNILYETDDVEIDLIENNYGIMDFLDEAKESVKTQPVSTNYGGYKGNYGGNYGGNYSGNYGGYGYGGSNTYPYNYSSGASASASASKAASASPKKKGKRKKDTAATQPVTSGVISDFEDDDDSYATYFNYHRT